MHQQKGKKILLYFFLLLFAGSISNINLKNLDFKKIEHVKVTGLDEKNNLILSKKIKELNLNNIFFIDKKKVGNLINSNNLIERYSIFKKYPSSLYIDIDKTEFIGRINYNGNFFLIGSNGKLIENNLSNKELPFIFGKPSINEFLNFIDIINQSMFSYNQVKNLYYFSSKRWDLELNDNIIIKLSKKNPIETLNLTYEFLQNQKISNIKIIDARVENQIILND